VEDLLDWIEIGTVGRQEEQLGTGRAYRPADRLAFVTAVIVDVDNVSRSQRG
jgi:hypothetical protein